MYFWSRTTLILFIPRVRLATYVEDYQMHSINVAIMFRKLGLTTGNTPLLTLARRVGGTMN